MTDTTTQAVERCAECTCKDGGIFCNWIVHGDPQVRQLVKDHAALLAERDAAELRARESALDAIAAYGQAAEAHEAQLAAEAKLATARGALADLVSWFDGGPSSHGPWIIASGDHGADDAVAVARALTDRVKGGGE